MEIAYDERGLVPVIVQDWRTGEVLTLAYANAEAVRRTCHTGERTCFHNGELEPPAPHEALAILERSLAERAAERPEGSYTVTLLEDPALAGEKVREEAEEVTRAVREESDERVDEEAADVLYHLAVLLCGRGRSFADAA